MRRVALIYLLVFILKSAFVHAQQTIVIQPGPDESFFTYVNSAFPYDNFYIYPSIIAAAWTYQGEFGVGRSFLKFDLSLIPENVEIIHAKLDMYYNPTSAHVGHAGNSNWRISLITEDWDFKDMNWYKQPAVSNSEFVTLPPAQTYNQNFENIDVTELIIQCLANPDQYFGFGFRVMDENIYNSIILSSCQHTNPLLWPRLSIVYHDCISPQASFSYTVNDSVVNFTNLSTEAEAYFWDFGDGSYSVDKHPAHKYQMQLDYFVCLYTSNECGISNYCDSVYFCEEPFGSFTFEIEGLIVAFNDICNHTTNIYWSFGDGYFSDLANPVHTYQDTGVFIVELTMINDCMSRTISDTLIISKTNHDELDGDRGLVIFPNPSHGLFLIDLLIPQYLEIVSVFDSRGRLIRQYSVNKKIRMYEIDLSDCHSGVYYVRTHTTDGSTETGRLVVIYDK